MQWQLQKNKKLICFTYLANENHEIIPTCYQLIIIHTVGRFQLATDNIISSPLSNVNEAVIHSSISVYTRYLQDIDVDMC